LILLIAAVLTREEIKSLSEFAKILGLEVLLEVQQRRTRKSIMPTLDMTECNNRDLKTFEVSLDFSKQLAQARYTDDFVKISKHQLDRSG
jgi:indole-3-glycerol phosphate synthase